MPSLLDIILYDEYILKNKNKLIQEKKYNFKEENIFEENKKLILDSFVNYPRLELIKRYKIQTYQFLMNKNYRNIFLKFLVIPLTFELSYNIYKNKYKI